MSTPRASGALHHLTPHLMYRDAGGGIAFCVTAFGANQVMRHTEHARIAHAQLRIGDSLLMVSQAQPADPAMPAAEDGGPSAIGLFLEVDDADATVARALALGATLVYPIADRDHGRSGGMRDPFGHLWHVASQPRAGALA